MAPNGTVTSQALAGSATAIDDLAVATDGAVWALPAGGFGDKVQRGAPGQALSEITLPEGRVIAIGAGRDASILAVGSNDYVVASDGTTSPLAGLLGFEREVTTIDGTPWVIGLDTVAAIGVGNTVTNHDLDLPASSLVSAGTEGPDGDGWVVTNGNGIDDSLLARFDGTGRTGLTVVGTGPSSESRFEATDVVADPASDRLWAVGRRSSDSRLLPIALDRRLSAVALDDLAPTLTFGVATPVHAQITDWDAGPAPTGTVTFSHHGVTLATVPVAADGSADAQVLPPYQGLTLRATYSGDATHAPSSSTTRSRSVGTPATTLTIVPPPQPWRPGTAGFAITVTSPSGAKPSGTVTFEGTTVAVSGGATSIVRTTLFPGLNTVGAVFTPSEGYAAANTTLPAAMARWDTNEENYVGAAYLRLFGRLPDAGGRTYWANKLKTGLSRDRFALAQVATPEYRRKLAKRVGLVAPNATVAQAQPTVDAMARKTVRELLVDHWSAGKKVVACRDTIPPTFAAPGSFTCWVKLIFTTFTGSADSEDQAWAAKYGNTPAGRRAIAEVLIYSDTAVRPVVELAYATYLNRPPDPGGWSYWTKKIQGGMREEGVEARVLGSDEFYRRTLLPAPS
ncbi:DUF4214 domain-containing protein [Aquihabitans daechungensis]|uniref:DUF4214 domain-containing protein n=1 Tax=Aquihabitans daechungensis TaxID=1052257 RepID=UPI003B9FBC50